jgi:hypothetical protein
VKYQERAEVGRVYQRLGRLWFGVHSAGEDWVIAGALLRPEEKPKPFAGLGGEAQCVGFPRGFPAWLSRARKQKRAMDILAHLGAPELNLRPLCPLSSPPSFPQAHLDVMIRTPGRTRKVNPPLYILTNKLSAVRDRPRAT